LYIITAILYLATFAIHSHAMLRYIY